MYLPGYSNQRCIILDNINPLISSVFILYISVQKTVNYYQATYYKGEKILLDINTRTEHN